MDVRMDRAVTKFAVLSGLLASTSVTYAQVVSPPDAGRLLQEQPQLLQQPVERPGVVVNLSGGVVVSGGGINFQSGQFGIVLSTPVEF